MTNLFLLFIFLIFALCARAQFKLDGVIEKYNDVYENSYYPTASLEASYTSKKSYCSVSWWSGLDTDNWWPYYNINFGYKEWLISYNPFKPDIYNYKIQITYTKPINYGSRFKTHKNRT